jgi:hypothetical protein
LGVGGRHADVRLDTWTETRLNARKARQRRAALRRGRMHRWWWRQHPKVDGAVCEETGRPDATRRPHVSAAGRQQPMHGAGKAP